MDPHPHRYALGWKDHGSSSKITHTCTVSFAFGPCDATKMNWCGMLLGQAYQYDWKAQLYALNNTYLLHKDNIKYLICCTVELPQQVDIKIENHSLTFNQQHYPQHHYVPKLQSKVQSTVLKDSCKPLPSSLALFSHRPQLPEDTTSRGHSTNF